MVRKLFIVVFIYLFIIFSERALGNPLPFDAIYTVGYEGSNIQKTIFGLNEKPWLYLNLPEPSGVFNFNITKAWWESPVGDFYFTLEPGFYQEIWLSLDDGIDTNNNPVSWFDVRRDGLWNINAAYWYPLSNEFGAGTASFEVIPEPMTLTLFAAGGGWILAGRYYWKKRKTRSFS